MKEILEMADNDILVTNDQGNILYANTSFLMEYPEMKDCFTEKNINDIYSANNGEADIVVFMKQNLNTACWLIQKATLEAVAVQITTDLWEGQQAYFCFFNKQRMAVYEESRTILNQVSFAIWRTDMEGRFCFVNKAFIKQLAEEIGYDTNQCILGKKVEEVWDKPMSNAIRQAENIVKQTKNTYLFEGEIERKNRRRWYIFKLIPILNDEGDITYIAGICEENTYYKCIETAIKKSYPEDEKDITEGLQFSEVDEIIEDMRERLQADGLYIAIVQEDTLYVTNKAGIALEEFKDTNVRHGARQWAEYVSKKQGLFEAKDIERFIKEEDKSRFTGRYKYYFYQPINLGNKLKAFITGYYIDKKPDLKEQSLWLPGVCQQLAILIRNRVTTNAVEVSMNKLRTKEDELNRIINTAIDLVVIMNREGIITEVSECWEEQLGWKQEEMVGKNLKQFFYSEDRRDIVREVKQYEEAKQKGIVRIICSDATLKWYQWHMKYDIKSKLIIFTATNINEYMKKKIETEEREAENFKEDFLINISHEFRTPVNVILSAVQLLGIMRGQADGLCAEDFDKYTDKIRHNGHRLLRLTNNLIELSQVEMKSEKINAVNTNIVSLVENIVKGVRKCIDKNKIEIRFITNISEEMIACDIDKIEKIVLNLISNSIKYAKIDEKANIEVSVMNEQEEICISVKDNGMGISKEKIDMIFEPFVKESKGLNRPAEGSGIGLALVKGYVQAHGGRIEVESDEGIGSKFSIYLPIIISDNTELKQGDFRSIVEQCKVELSDIL